jgi:hypothetical protein
MSEKKEKGWIIFHNDGAHAKEWTQVENSAKVLGSEHVEKLHQMESNFKTINQPVTERELKDLRAFSKSWGFDPDYLPPEHLNTIGEFGGFNGKTDFYTYDAEAELGKPDVNNPRNKALIREHERHIGAQIAEDREKSQWNSGF